MKRKQCYFHVISSFKAVNLDFMQTFKIWDEMRSIYVNLVASLSANKKFKNTTRCHLNKSKVMSH